MKDFREMLENFDTKEDLENIKKESEKEFGKYVKEGVQYFLLEIPYADSINDGGCFKASAINKDGNRFTLVWDAYEYDSEYYCNEAGYVAGHIEDASDAANWDIFKVEEN